MKLIGSNGYDVGSPEYFRNINQSSIVGDIMWEFSNGSHCVDYRDALDKLCKSVVEVIHEVHSDLKRYAEVLSFFPKEEREETLKFLEKINEVLKFGYSNASTFDACKAYLTLSAYDTKRKSYESMSRVEEAAKKVENGYKVSFSTGMEYIRKALDYGINFTIGDDAEKKAFFDDVLDGKDKDFLQDVYNFLKFKKEKSSLQGKCYKTILSREYIEKLSCEAISSRLYDKLKNERSYYDVLRKGFEDIKEKIISDISYKEGNILKYNYDILLSVEKDFQKLGININISERVKFISYSNSNERNYNKIRRLQCLLNEMKIPGYSGILNEDGIWGKETECAWNTFLQCFDDGIAPSLIPVNISTEDISSGETSEENGLVLNDIVGNINTVNKGIPHSLLYINPLENKWYNIEIGDIKAQKNGALLIGETRSLYFDHPHGKHQYYHFNTKAPINATERQSQILKSLDHTKVSLSTYNFFKNFDNVVKKVKKAGKVFLVAGIVADAYDLGVAVTEDLRDEDKNLGVKTIQKSAEITGGWAGSALGAKLGAMGGSALGTMIAPGIGTAVGGFVFGLVGGVAGAVGGEAFCSWVIDITMLE